MAEPFLSEIRLMSFNFAPKAWAMCNGQLLPINQNQPLFSLLGTTFGGNGQTNFGLPNLRGRVPVHVGNGFTLGQQGGETEHVLNQSELPTHVHLAMASATDANAKLPTSNVFGAAANLYGPPGATTTTVPGTVGTAGGSQAHTNMQPYLVLNFIIA